MAIIVFVQAFLIIYVVLVAIYVKSKYKARKLDTMNTSFQEALWCMVYIFEGNWWSPGRGNVHADLLGVPSPMTLVYCIFLNKFRIWVQLIATLITGNLTFHMLILVEPLVFTKMGYSRKYFLWNFRWPFLFQHVFTPTRQCQGQVPSTLARRSGIKWWTPCKQIACYRLIGKKWSLYGWIRPDLQKGPYTQDTPISRPDGGIAIW